MPLHETARKFAALPLLAGLLLLCSPLQSQDLVRIEGLSSVSQSQAKEWIQSQLTFINSAGVSMARADDVAYFLENAMRDRGYKEATVDWKLQGEAGSKQILLVVSEGTSSQISSFSIEGNTALADDAIIELLTDATRKRLDLKPDGAVPFVRSDLLSGKKKVKQFYSLLGYQSAKVDLDTEPGSTGTKVLLTIEEGIQLIVGGITFPSPPDEAMAKGFEKVQEDFVGRKLNPPLVANLESRIRSLAVNGGYFESSVSVIPEATSPLAEESKEVQLVVSVDWGSPVTVSGIRVNGNAKVRSHFFDRHFEDIVGAPYSPSETNKRVDSLLQTGAFETIRADPVQQEDGSFLLDVEVEESYSRTLGIFGGFTNYEGPIGGFEFGNLNLFGSVRTVDSKIEFSRRGARGEINYEDPWFLGSDYRFRSGLFGQHRKEEGYEKWETGGNYEFSRKFGSKDRNTISLFGKASYTDVQETDIAAALIGDPTYFVNLVGLSLSYDQRDNPGNPKKGFIAQGSASVSSSGLGSEVEFFKATGRLGYYHPVGPHNFRMAARAGSIAPIGNTRAIPIDLRFYNGGPQTVRSFQERSLGAIDPGSGYHIGGEFYTTFNVEYEIPIEAFDGLSIVGFGDAGNLLPDADDASLDNMRYAIGLGLRYRTPIGPIRFEYGYNPDQRPGEPQGTFHAGFGFTY